MKVPTSYYGATFSTSQDVELVMPNTPRWGTINVTGGRNVRLVGGSTVLSAITSGTAAVRFTGASGSVTIMNTNIDVNGLTDDGIDVTGSPRAPFTLFPDVYLLNDRVVGIHTDHQNNHGDLFQPQGSIGRLVVQNFTGRSNYQGFFIPPQFPITSASLQNVNLSYEQGGDPVTYLLWFLDPGTHETPYPVTLDNVWIEPRATQDAAAAAVAPWTNTKNASGILIGAVHAADGTVTWPSVDRVTGGVNIGVPQGGDFASAPSA